MFDSNGGLKNIEMEWKKLVEKKNTLFLGWRDKASDDFDEIGRAHV